MAIASWLTQEIQSTDIANHMLLRLHLMKMQCFIILEVLVAQLAIIMLGVLVTLERLFVIETTATVLISAWELLAEMGRIWVVARSLGVLGIMQRFRLSLSGQRCCCVDGMLTVPG